MISVKRNIAVLVIRLVLILTNISPGRIDARNINTLSRQKKKTTFLHSSLFPSSNRSASNSASSYRVHNSQTQSELSQATSIKSFATARTSQEATAPSFAAIQPNLSFITLDLSHFIPAFKQAEKQLGITYQHNKKAPISFEGIKNRAKKIANNVQDRMTMRQSQKKHRIEKKNFYLQHAKEKTAR